MGLPQKPSQPTHCGELPNEDRAAHSGHDQRHLRELRRCKRAGKAPLLRCQSGYTPKLDRDGDGRAYE
ncbi:excalibur calcium-binding domain-containing protein [Deinococcus sp. RIT780]|nr:excalibur calcium-binding domain-containing protein [Deinococcus sp. RIT780]